MGSEICKIYAQSDAVVRQLPITEFAHKAANGELTISCRNRHCPKCQWRTAAAWLAAREAELLPVPHFHFVFGMA
jgi:Transposase zinc-binding domain